MATSTRPWGRPGRRTANMVPATAPAMKPSSETAAGHPRLPSWPPRAMPSSTTLPLWLAEKTPKSHTNPMAST